MNYKDGWYWVAHMDHPIWKVMYCMANTFYDGPYKYRADSFRNITGPIETPNGKAYL